MTQATYDSAMTSPNNTVLGKNSSKSHSQHEGAAYLPFGYLVDFLRFLYSNRDKINIITYRDLCWGEDFDYENSYPKEREAWLEQIKADKRQAKALIAKKKQKSKEFESLKHKKIHVLLQHDVDSEPQQTMALLPFEKAYHCPSNIMRFVNRIDRAHLENTGEVRFTEYPLDEAYLKKLEKHHFEIGYHVNAYEQSGFDYEKAIFQFENDLNHLKQLGFDIRFYSPHGGVRDKDGNSNNIVHPPNHLKHKFRWVHNRHSPFFRGRYSDGGMTLGKRDPEAFNLANFVQTWEPGKRYRILIHPQYYFMAYRPAHTLVGSPWYDEVLEAYRNYTLPNPIFDKICDRFQPMDLGPIWSQVKLKSFDL